MFTVNYKGYHIHGYIGKPECRIVDLLACSRIHHFKSLHAAKCWVTRRINQGE